MYTLYTFDEIFVIMNNNWICLKWIFWVLFEYSYVVLCVLMYVRERIMVMLSDRARLIVVLSKTLKDCGNPLCKLLSPQLVNILQEQDPNHIWLLKRETVFPEALKRYLHSSFQQCKIISDTAKVLPGKYFSCIYF